jgi:hypothetical protein
VNNERNGDESWKEEAKREKERLDAELKAEKERQKQFAPEPTFAQFLTGLAAQALLALGEAENPITKKTEVDLPAAKYIIDVIALLQEKTAGNLDEHEEAVTKQLLMDLRLKFVKASGGAQE